MSDPRTPLVRRIAESVIGDDRQIAWSLRAAPADLRRPHRVRSGAGASSRTIIRTEVLPWYANTHTESSATGRRTTGLREQARTIIRDAVGGDDDTLVIFTGSGSTGAIDKFRRVLELSTSGRSGRNGGLRRTVRAPLQRAAVARVGGRGGAYRRDAAGHDRRRPPGARAAPRHAGRPRLIGVVLGRLQRDRGPGRRPAITERLHRHGALACWDYAAAGRMCRSRCARDPDRPLSYLDAVFLSPHKFPGGPGTPGVLACDATWSATRCRRCPAVARSATCTPAASTTSTSRRTARRVAPPRSSSRSGPDWSSGSRRRSGRCR